MSFPAYPEYKDSGIAWLGAVPSHWRVVQTKREFRRRKDLNAGMVCEDRLALTMNGVVPRSLDDLDGLQSSDYEGYQIFEAGDLAFKLIDLQNIKTSRVGMVLTRGIMSPAYIRLEPSSAPTGRFGFWYFMALYWLQVFNNLGGGVRQTLGPEELLTVPFPLPKLDEQTAIAAFLDRETAKIDALVAEQERLIALLKEKRQAVISHAVTKGLNPNAPMKDSGIEWLGEIPGHWEVKRLRHIARLNPSKGEIGDWDGQTEVSFLPMEAIGEDGSLALDRTRPISDVSSGYTYFREGDVSIAKITPCFENGKGAVMRGLVGGVGFGTTELIVVRPDAGKTTPDYLNWIFRSRPFRALGEGFMYGAGGQKRVPDEFVRDFAIGLPPMVEQAQIVARLDQIAAGFDALSTEAQSTIALLQERRAALISAAVTGKIDVRGLAETSQELELA